MPCISYYDFLIKVVRIHQANTAAKKAAISISCCLVNRCGIETGSSLTKAGWLNSITLRSKNSFSDGSFMLTQYRMSNNECRMLKYIDTSSYSIFQVLHQVLGIFNAHTQANQRIAKAILNALFAWNGSMGHGSRMIDQR